MYTKIFRFMTATERRAVIDDRGAIYPSAFRLLHFANYSKPGFWG